MDNEHANIKEAEAQGRKNIQEPFRCKITVLKKAFYEDLYQQYPYGDATPCGRFEEGQVFISEFRWDPPAGFCAWAWADFRASIQSIHAGHLPVAVACCTDGLRPVTFKLERIDPSE